MTRISHNLETTHPHEHLLVVDDEHYTREAMATLLRDEGYRVTTAADGLNALKAIEHDVPELVISDVRMPRRDGYQLVRELRAGRKTAHVPIILISAIGQPARRVIGLDLGADDFVTKPVDFGELLARVRVQLRHAQDRKTLERRSLVDALTGVLNRRGLITVLQQEIARAARTASTLSVLMVDLDRLKPLNDRYGHAAGDTALRHVARSLVDAVRVVDHVGRYGGDEFLVVLPGTAAADLLATRLRAQRIRPLELEPDQVPVEVSIGTATLQPGDTADTLIERADAEMYRVKQAHSA